MESSPLEGLRLCTSNVLCWQPMLQPQAQCAPVPAVCRGYGLLPSHHLRWQRAADLQLPIPW